MKTEKTKTAAKAKSKSTAKTDFNKDFENHVKGNPYLHLGYIMMLVQKTVPEGDLLLKYVAELEKKLTSEECCQICEKIMSKTKSKK